MTPMVDTTQYRDSVKKAFERAAKALLSKEYRPDQGVVAVPLDDKELLGEGVYPPYTVKHWAGWVYQKRPDGKWDKLTRVPEEGAAVSKDSGA